MAERDEKKMASTGPSGPSGPTGASGPSGPRRSSMPDRRTLTAPTTEGQPTSLSDAEYAKRTEDNTSKATYTESTYDPATMKYTVNGKTARTAQQARWASMRSVDSEAGASGPSGPSGPTGP